MTSNSANLDASTPSALSSPSSPSPAGIRAGLLARLLGHSTLRIARWIPVRPGYGSRRAAFRQQAELFETTAPDGTVIACLRAPATQPAADGRPRLPVVMVHGWFEAKESHHGRSAPLRAAGHDVYAFDMRAHGSSQGKHVTFGCHERHDVAAVIDEIERRGWLPASAGGRVITMGNSLGAGTILQHAAEEAERGVSGCGGGRVAGVIAMAPFLSAAAATASYRKLYTPFLPHEWVMRGLRHAAASAGFCLDEACTLTAIAKIDIPVLLVGGERDRNLSLKDHTRVLAAAKTRGAVKLIEVPGAHHFNLYRETWPGLDEAVIAFCNQLPATNESIRSSRP